VALSGFYCFNEVEAASFKNGVETLRRKVHSSLCSEDFTAFTRDKIRASLWQWGQNDFEVSWEYDSLCIFSQSVP
jgi:hypothetical protein